MVDVKTKKRGTRKELKGAVVSRSGNKSIVVLVERRKLHPIYGKVIRQSRKFYAHDEKNETKVGDLVRIVETRPISRLKRWRVVEIIDKKAAEAISCEPVGNVL